MTNDDEPTRFEREARGLYQAAAEELDPATRSALRRARERALADRESPATRWLPHGRLPRAWLPRAWLPMGVAAAGAGALLVGALVLTGPTEESDPTTERLAEDFELLLEGEDLDLLAELDFIQWLETQPDVG